MQEVTHTYFRPNDVVHRNAVTPITATHMKRTYLPNNRRNHMALNAYAQDPNSENNKPNISKNISLSSKMVRTLQILTHRHQRITCQTSNSKEYISTLQLTMALSSLYEPAQLNNSIT